MKRILEWMLRLKSGELAGADSWAPRFAADYNNWVILGLFVVFAALVALTIVCYLREGDTRRRTKMTIAAVRILVIVLIFVLLFQPGLVLRYKKDIYSTVIVSIDDSLSMSLKDRYADVTLRSAMAEKLGVSEDELAAINRTEIVRRLLSRQGGPLAELSRDHPLVLLRFSTSQPGSGAEEGKYTRKIGQVEVAGDDPSRQSASDEQVASAIAKLSAGGYETNLSAALRDAVDRLQGGRVAGVVLVSDGQPTTASDTGNRLSAALAYIRQRGIPVFAVGIGDPVPPQNVALLRLQGPVEVRRGSSVELKAYLSNRNCGGQSVEVRLFRRPEAGGDWTDTGVIKVVNLLGQAGSARNEAQEVTLIVTKADELGNFIYKAEAKPLDREFSDADNAATAKVRVSEEKIKILFVSGDAGWEFNYLRSFLLQSPDRYAVSVWQQNAETKFNQEASSKEMRLTRLPRTRPDLFKYDAIILYDPAYTKAKDEKGGGFDEQFVEMLESFVSDHHGGLCYIASNKYSDINLTGKGPFKPLSALLPVVLGERTGSIARRIAHDRPNAWPMVPTALGLDHPVLRMGRNTKETATIWKILPGVYWSHPVVSLKPLASSLAGSSDPADRTSGVDSEANPIVAVQHYGKGRSLYLGSDETWRWRAVEDGLFYRQFWSNVIDVLAAGRLQKKLVIITTGVDRFTVGQKMRIKIEAYGRDYRPLKQDELIVQIIDATDGTAVGEPIILRSDTKQKTGGYYQSGEVPLMKTGTFKLEIKPSQDGISYKKDEVAGKTITVTLPEEEFIHPEADLATLKTIAPEKRFMMIHESDGLTKMIPHGKMTVFNDVPHELWDIPLAVVLVVLLLAIEWILRKKHNMA